MCGIFCLRIYRGILPQNFWNFSECGESLSRDTVCVADHWKWVKMWPGTILGFRFSDRICVAGTCVAGSCRHNPNWAFFGPKFKKTQHNKFIEPHIDTKHLQNSRHLEMAVEFRCGDRVCVAENRIWSKSNFDFFPSMCKRSGLCIP